MLRRHTFREMQVLKDPNVKCSIFSESQGSIRGWFEYDLVRYSEIRSGYHIGENVESRVFLVGSAGR